MDATYLPPQNCILKRNILSTVLTHERFSPHKDMDLHSIKHRLTLKTKTFIISLIVETVCYYYNNILFFLALQLSRFQSNIIINYICRKISKISSAGILTLLKCALQYICPPPLWNLRINLSVDKLHPPIFLPHFTES